MILKFRDGVTWTQAFGLAGVAGLMVAMLYLSSQFWDVSVWPHRAPALVTDQGTMTITNVPLVTGTVTIGPVNPGSGTGAFVDSKADHADITKTIGPTAIKVVDVTPTVEERGIEPLVWHVTPSTDNIVNMYDPGEGNVGHLDTGGVTPSSLYVFKTGGVDGLLLTHTDRDRPWGTAVYLNPKVIDPTYAVCIEGPRDPHVDQVVVVDVNGAKCVTLAQLQQLIDHLDSILSGGAR